jgi:hypothetical protein
MKEKYQQYEKTIKKVHRLGWTPKYAQEFSTRLSNAEFMVIAVETFRNLDWEIVYQDEKTIEAKRNHHSLGFDRFTEGITATFEYGKIKVESVSLGNEMWDLGRNSKRVRLFIYAFQDTEKTIDKETLQNSIREKESVDNWDDYVIPDTLPEPNKTKEPNFQIQILGSVLVSVILAFLIAKVSASGVYVIGIFEFIVGFAMGFAFKYLFKLSNYTHYDKIHQVVIGSIGLIYVLNQYLQYEMVVYEYNYQFLGFFEYMNEKLTDGLMIKNSNTGWIGFIIHWGLQLVLTYYIATLFVIGHLTKFQLNRIPPEVLDFAFYHFIKDKTEDQVRNELASKGWTHKQNQDEVFEAIGALQTTREFTRVN